MKIVDMHMKERLRQYSGPDAWNDLDMMEVGNGMTVYEDKSHFDVVYCLCHGAGYQCVRATGRRES